MRKVFGNSAGKTARDSSLGNAVEMHLMVLMMLALIGADPPLFQVKALLIQVAVVLMVPEEAKSVTLSPMRLIDLNVGSSAR